MSKALRVMDDRCPLGLQDFPTSVCPLAVERLRAMRNNKGDAQNVKVGCEWYIASKEANYCFHKYMAQNEGESHATIDIASLLHVTQAVVYSDLTKAVGKVKEAGVGELLLGEESDE